MVKPRTRRVKRLRGGLKGRTARKMFESQDAYGNRLLREAAATEKACIAKGFERKITGGRRKTNKIIK